MTWWAWLLLVLAAWCVVSLGVGIVAGRSVAVADRLEPERAPDPNPADHPVPV